MYKIVNRKRQVLPVLIKKNGEVTIINLGYKGDSKYAYTEEVTKSLSCLERRGIVSILEEKEKETKKPKRVKKKEDDGGLPKNLEEQETNETTITRQIADDM